jgi:hypothetical protein
MARSNSLCKRARLAMVVRRSASSCPLEFRISEFGLRISEAKSEGPSAKRDDR